MRRPYGAAVFRISCHSPVAPFGETALGWNPLSTAGRNSSSRGRPRSSISAAITARYSRLRSSTACSHSRRRASRPCDVAFYTIFVRKADRVHVRAPVALQGLQGRSGGSAAGSPASSAHERGEHAARQRDRDGRAPQQSADAISAAARRT